MDDVETIGDLGNRHREPGEALPIVVIGGRRVGSVDAGPVKRRIEPEEDFNLSILVHPPRFPLDLATRCIGVLITGHGNRDLVIRRERMAQPRNSIPQPPGPDERRELSSSKENLHRKQRTAARGTQYELRSKDDVLGRSGRTAHDQIRGEHLGLAYPVPIHRGYEQGGGGGRHAVDRLTQRCQPWRCVGHRRRAVEVDNREVVGHVATPGPNGGARLRPHGVERSRADRAYATQTHITQIAIIVKPIAN